MQLPKRLTPAEIVLKIYHNQIMGTVAVISGFWLIFFLFYLSGDPYHEFLRNYITIRAEYTIVEQISKFYLFVIVLISVLSYQASTEATKIKLSISFLFLGLILYISESNMIPEIIQPVFGVIIFFSTCILLFRVRSWVSIFFLLVGFLMIGTGLVSDIVNERKTISSILPSLLLYLFDPSFEEYYDTLGIAFLCLSAILCFQDILQDIIKRKKKVTLLILLASGMISFGNGFLHYQYRPSAELHCISLLVTISGFLGLVFLAKGSSKKHATFTLVTEELFYIFIFVFFVMLPSLHGVAYRDCALFLWLPTMFFMAVYLWRRHPANCKDVRSQY